MNPEEQIIDGDTKEKATMKANNYAFPLHITFKIGTIYNDLSVKDSKGQYIGYVKQKLFKLKDHVQIYTDDSKNNLAYEVRADKIAGFNINYAFKTADGKPLGKVARKGARSIWKANYLIFDPNDTHKFTIREEKPWVKVLDSFVGFISGYVFNPTYIVKDTQDRPVARLVKEPSFFSRRFSLRALGEMKNGEDELILLSVVTMALNERRRG